MLAFVDDLKNVNDIYFLKMKMNKQGNCEIRINGRLSIKLCNETVAELLCVLPFITSFQSINLNIAGNIISDIKKSSLEIYENFRSLKAKWKAMHYLR